MNPSACPDQTEFRHLLAGHLSDEQLATIATHLEQCASCANVLAELSRQDGSAIPLLSPKGSERAVDRDAIILERIKRQMPFVPQLEAIGWPNIPDFTIERVLGTGGQATVFLARQVSVANRPVAIKVINAGNENSVLSQVSRLEIEAAAFAQTEHANIVRIYSVGLHEGRPYLVLEYCEGGTLRDRLDQRRFTPEAAASLVEILARAIHFAHVNGIIHRDIKPRNIYFDVHDIPKVGDFGLARFVSGEADITRTNQVMGTIEYMSPEQAQGDSRHVGPATDIYALGVVLYQLLTNELPFRGTPRMVFQQVLHDEPRSPRNLNECVSRDLNTICLKAMAKESSRRYESAQEMAADLRRWLEGQTIVARPASFMSRGWRWCGRHRAVAILSTCVVVSLFACVTALFHSVGSLNRETISRQTAEDERGKAESQATMLASQARELTAAKEEAERNLYGQLIHRAAHELEANNVRQARQLLALTPASLRGWEYRFVRRCLDRSQSTMLLGPQPSAVAASQDGKLLAVGFYTGAVKLIDAASGQASTTFKVDGQVEALAFDLSKTMLAVAHSSYKAAGGFGIVVHSLADGKPKSAIAGQLEQVNALAFSDDQKWLASGAGGASGEHAVKVWDTQTWMPLHILRAHSSPVHAVAFDHQSSSLVSADADLVIWWDIQSGKEKRQIRMPRVGFRTIQFSRDDVHMIAGGEDGVIRIWNADETKTPIELRGHADSIRRLEVTADNSILSASDDRSVRRWSMDGAQQGILRGHETNVIGAFAGGEPATVMSLDAEGALKKWSIPTDADVHISLGPEASMTALATTPDNGRLLIGGTDESVKLWDVRHNRLIAAMRHQLQGFRSDISDIKYLARDGRVVSSGLDRAVRVWNVEDYREELVLRAHTAKVEAIATSSDCQLVASVGGYDKLLLLWDLSNGKEIGRAEADPWWVGSVAFSPKGDMLATGGSQKKVTLWNAKTLERLQTLSPLQGWVQSIVFSPNSEMLAAAGSSFRVWSIDGKVLWDGETGTPVKQVEFSPDGRRLMTIDKDMVRLWDSRTGTQVWTRSFAKSGVKLGRFTPDGQRLVIGCFRSPSLYIFDASPVPIQ